MGWGKRIRLICKSGWWLRSREVAFRAIKLRRNLVSGSARRSFGFSGSATPAAARGQDHRLQAEEGRGCPPRLVVATMPGDRLTLRGLVAELAERGLKVDYRSICESVHAEKLSKKR